MRERENDTTISLAAVTSMAKSNGFNATIYFDTLQETLIPLMTIAANPLESVRNLRWRTNRNNFKETPVFTTERGSRSYVD